MPGTRETIFRHLLHHEWTTESLLSEGCPSGNGRVAEILKELGGDGYLIATSSEQEDEQTPCRYGIRHTPETFYRIWLENPDLRAEIRNSPRVWDLLARERLRVGDDGLNAEVCGMLEHSELFFELALKNRNIARIIANWDRIISDSGFDVAGEDLPAEDETLPAYTYHSFFGFCVFYDCLTTESQNERIRLLRSVQENTPTLMAVTKIISLLK